MAKKSSHSIDYPTLLAEYIFNHEYSDLPEYIIKDKFKQIFITDFIENLKIPNYQYTGLTLADTISLMFIVIPFCADNYDPGAGDGYDKIGSVWDKYKMPGKIKVLLDPNYIENKQDIKLNYKYFGKEDSKDSEDSEED